MPAGVSREVQGYRWLIFALLSTSYILVYFHRLCVSVLAVDLMNDLNAGGSLIGVLGAAYFYSYAVMQLPAGLLSDSWGPRKTITLFFVVASIGSVILGLAPTAAWAIVGRTIAGIGIAMLFVPTLKILAEWFTPREFASMTGLLLAMGGIGSLIAATPLVWLSNWIGWRSSFVFIGWITLCLAVLVGLFVRNRPSDKGWQPLTAPAESRSTAVGLGQAVRHVLSCRHFWPVAVWFFFDFAIFFSLGGLWGGPYLMHVHHLSKAETGHILSMMALGLVVGSPLLCWLSDRVFRRRKPVLLLTSVGMMLITALMTFTTAIPGWGLYVLFFMLTVCGNAVGAVAFTMNKEMFPVAMAGTATGLVNLFPFVGGAVFQPLVGFLLERHGRTGDIFSPSAYQSAFMVLWVCSWIALGAALLSRETMTDGRMGG
ncbi:MAG: MFS transporter [Desulfobacterales bacterium]